MKKLEIKVEGPYIEVKIDGIVQKDVKCLKLDALIINGVVLEMKSVIFPTMKLAPEPEPTKEINDQTVNRA